MTFKAIVFVYRKPSISLAQFKHHYECSHVPLVQSLTGHLFPLAHTRRYIQEADRPPTAQCDVVMEMTFGDRSAFEAFSAKLMQGDNGAEVATDCERFMDTARTAMVVVEDILETTREERL
ncbi:hypothetical protein K469DRAFT_715772 [Zopfia rhizophila CBS 207.26]|uniref:EthD domain-containing protein n=1 Tax=Zopfia rhizophila CBS 207.26 TaxID=1314779 RepID=A0A6A6DR91_9PEZI|nr:hypothetical protein K469DRAFT_715772 [Zopfia rhizophila CBS 207.26]